MNKKRTVLVIYVVLLVMGFAGVSSVLYAHGLVSTPQGLSKVTFDKDSLTGTNINNITLSDGGRAVNFTINDFSSDVTLKYKVRNDSNKNIKLGSPALNCYADDLTFKDDGILASSLVLAGEVTNEYGLVTIISNNNLVRDISVECVLNVSSEEEIVPIVITKSKPEVGKGAAGIFETNASNDNFQNVKVDGKTIDNSMFSLASNNSKVFLNRDYTETLALGKHTIEIVYDRGIAKTSFNITEPIIFTINDVLYKTSPGTTFEDWLEETGGNASGNSILWVSPKNASSDLNSSMFNAGGKWELYKNDSNNRLYLKEDSELSTDALCLNTREFCDITIFSQIEANGVYTAYSKLR